MTSPKVSARPSGTLQSRLTIGANCPSSVITARAKPAPKIHRPRRLDEPTRIQRTAKIAKIPMWTSLSKLGTKIGLG
jgi:hypothetical protein